MSKLIRKYLASSEWITPLSIAVFGRPGSGKSTVIKEIINSVDPGRKSDPLTFNLAQFNSVDQLTEAFHHVQDRILSSPHEVPLVIFDEFDSSFDGQMGWLKYFLAPMEDGQFRGKTDDYRIGRAIFLFSGGTSYTFEQFKDSPAADNKETKLDDFVGRLKEYLDVPDINEEKDQEPGRAIKLRRAIILRALLEEHAQPIFQTRIEVQQFANIRSEVIRAFLKTTKYEYGVRSMKAIIQMSRWIDGEFVAASLPSTSQLESHVDCQSFIDKLHIP